MLPGRVLGLLMPGESGAALECHKGTQEKDDLLAIDSLIGTTIYRYYVAKAIRITYY